YITYWNQKRIKLSLGGLSPVEYRTEYQKAGVQFMTRLIRPTSPLKMLVL
ncbi:IS3 family transposase, partial [Escherichia coli]